MFEKHTEHISFLEEHSSMHSIKQHKLIRFLKKDPLNWLQHCVYQMPLTNKGLSIFFNNIY